MSHLANTHATEDVHNLGPEFDNSTCLMLSELRLLLDMIAANRVQSSLHSRHLTSSKVYQKTKSYVDTFSVWQSEDQVVQGREILNISQSQSTEDGEAIPALSPFEHALLGNLMPKNSEEAKSLIQTLRLDSTEEESLDQALSQLTDMQKFTVQ